MSPEFNEKMQWARYLQHEHDDARIKERARMARIEEEATKITLYADDTPYQEEPMKAKLVTLYGGGTVLDFGDGRPYQFIDLKDIDDMSEEEYNDKLKDAWLRKTHYETIKDLTMMAKYYNYEVEEEKKEEHKDNSEIILGGMMYSTIGLIVFYILYELVKSFFA